MIACSLLLWNPNEEEGYFITPQHLYIAFQMFKVHHTVPGQSKCICYGDWHSHGRILFATSPSCNLCFKNSLFKPETSYMDLSACTNGAGQCEEEKLTMGWPLFTQQFVLTQLLQTRTSLQGCQSQLQAQCLEGSQ